MASPLEIIVGHLKNGDIVGFPTDTVYGCGVSVKDAEGARVVNDFKHRDSNQPVQWLIANKSDIDFYAKDVPDYARELMDENWPGGYSFIFKASENVPENFLCGLDTIAFRMPKCACARKVITALGCPIAASSANFTGDEPPQFKDDVAPEFMDALPYALTCLHGQCHDATGIPSTIIDCTGDEPKTIR